MGIQFTFKALPFNGKFSFVNSINIKKFKKFHFLSIVRQNRISAGQGNTLTSAPSPGTSTVVLFPFSKI
jgi:hypothetical protein